MERTFCPSIENFDLSNEEELRLVASECRDCGKRYFPRGKYCPACMSENLGAYTMNNVGKLYSYSVVHTKSPSFKTPYAIGYVDFPENLRVLAQIEDWENARLDQEVKLELGVIGLDDEGNELTGYKVRPCHTKA